MFGKSKNLLLVINLAVILFTGCSSANQHLSDNNITRVDSLKAEPLFIETIKGFGKEGETYTLAVQSFDDLSGSRSDGGISTSVAGSGKFLTEFLLSHPQFNKKFRLFNRNNLNALLTERKLAETFEQERKNDMIKKSNAILKSILQDSLKHKYGFKSLEPARYLINGAVIGYDKAIDEHGSGLGLMGANANQKTSIDQLHVMVQLVDTINGQIISVGTASENVNSVLTTKGYFGLVNPYRILELENGNVKNDATTIAFFLALQAAIMEMFSDV